MSAALPPLLELQALRIAFRGSEASPVVAGLGFRLERGRSLAMVGRSGAGKTLTALAIMGLLPRSAVVTGSVRLEGKELIGLDESSLRPHRGRDITLIPQDAARTLNPTMPIGRQIAETIRAHTNTSRREARGRAAELLHRLRLPARSGVVGAYPHELSGGMQQRATIAMALATRPKLVIADESTRALDPPTSAAALEALDELRRDLGTALVLVCHDLEAAAEFADEVVVLGGGRVLERLPGAKLFTGPQTPEARRLVAASVAIARAPARGGRPAARKRGIPLLEARDLWQRFRGADRRPLDVLRGVSFALSTGETLGLIGGSGMGKSVLARSLVLAPPAAGGTVLLEGEPLTGLRGRPLRERRRRIQLIFQDPFGSVDPYWRAADIVAEPARACGAGGRERQRMAWAALEQVGLRPADYAARRPAELSGGECQRVAIARALTAEPCVVVCDEALASLDVVARAHILDLLETLRGKHSLAYLFISHDVAAARRISDRIGVLHAGRLCELGPVDAVCRAPRHPYTRALLGERSTRAVLREPTEATQTARHPRGAVHHSAGCDFRAACPRAALRCTVETPRLVPVAEGHLVACHDPLG